MLKVAQCWDDGVATDIRLTLILKQYGAKATFNLNPGAIQEKTVPPYWHKPGHRGWSFKGFSGGRVGKDLLKDVYGDFQVASHCWMHENAGMIPDGKFLEAALSGRRFLEETFERPCRGFAWPCGRTTPDTCRLLREAGFLYGRTTQYTDDVTKCADTMALASSSHFQAWDFWDKYDQAKKGSGVFYFWGHSYETLNHEMLWAELESRIRMISEDPEAEWVDVVDLVPLCTGQAKTE